MKKTKIIYELMYRLAKGDELTINDYLANDFDISTKTLGRYLNDIKDDYEDLITIEKKQMINHSRKPYVYRAINKSKDLAMMLQFFFERRTDLGWVLQLLHEKDSTLANEGEYHDEIHKIISQESDIFVFKSTPFEIFDTEHQKIFSELKRSIKYNVYKNLSYNYTYKEHLEDVKCLKLIFTQNNWYVAIENREESFRLLRVSFIEDVSASKKGSYQVTTVHKYESYYPHIQNAMTLYSKPIQKAICRASPKIAMYFQENMKSFLNSQKYLTTNEDGSIDFEISYTQPLEILPFIKQWLPDIKILEPVSLVNVLKQDLVKASNDY